MLIRRAWARRIAMMWLSSGSVSRRDLEDAVDHMQDFSSKRLNLSDFNVSKPKRITMRELENWDDLGSWPEWGDGDLKGLDDEELFDEFDSFRGSSFAHKAMKWVKAKEVSPIVLVELEDGHRAVGDGRGRVSVALGLGWSHINAVILTPK